MLFWFWERKLNKSITGVVHTAFAVLPAGSLALSGLLALSSVSFQARAVAITTSAIASDDVTGVIDSDAKSNPPASLLSEAVDPDTFFGADPAVARAAMNESGVGSVAVSGIWADGSSSKTTLSAVATWSDTYTNTSSAAQSVRYDFSIDPADLRIFDFAGVSDASPDAMRASYSVNILHNGSSVFSSDATLIGGGNGHVLERNGTDFGSTFVSNPFFTVIGYTFDAYVGSLDLGILAVGESLDIGYEIRAEVTSPGFETGAAASIGDPNNLSGSGLAGAIVANVPTGTVSVPGSLWLIGGLLGMVSVRRNKG